MGSFNSLICCCSLNSPTSGSAHLLCRLFQGRGHHHTSLRLPKHFGPLIDRKTAIKQEKLFLRLGRVGWRAPMFNKTTVKGVPASLFPSNEFLTETSLFRRKATMKLSPSRRAIGGRNKSKALFIPSREAGHLTRHGDEMR